MNPRIYLAITTGVACATALLILSIAVDTKNYTGSQVRAGGYLESDFAPTQPQQVFAEPLFRTGKQAADYDQYYDLVVLGDSFTEDQTASWLNFVARDLNASALFLHIDKTDLKALLENPIFRKKPPRHLFFETFEGKTFLRFNRLNQVADVRPFQKVDTPNEAFTASNIDVALVTKTAPPPTKLKDAMGVAAHHLRSELKRKVLGEREGAPLKIDIDCVTCFSHPLSSKVLIGPMKNAKFGFKMKWRDNSAEGIQTVKRIVESNGWTTVNSLVFPRKINLYQKYTSITSPPTIFDEHFPTEKMALIPLLKPLRQAIDEGAVDVYAPHDHHATASGHRVAAEVILNFLKNS